MATIGAVPLNTMFADLDETLRALLKRDLDRHGFEGVEIAFDAPGSEWSSALSTPTVNLFLYDLREATSERLIEWDEERAEGRATSTRPPLRMEVSFAVTGWTREVEDEHRLLSQVLAILYAHPVLPSELLVGTLGDPAAQRYPIKTRVGQARGEGKADFWSAVGGQYKASIDYVVTVSCEAGTVLERGPEVRTQTIRVSDRTGGRALLIEEHRAGGTVRDGEGLPAAGVWVALPAEGRLALTDTSGRFRFGPLGEGAYRCVARGDGDETAEDTLQVPGGRLDLVLGTLARRRRRP
jgi:Pvc16 N-terminal domain